MRIDRPSRSKVIFETNIDVVAIKIFNEMFRVTFRMDMNTYLEFFETSSETETGNAAPAFTAQPFVTSRLIRS